MKRSCLLLPCLLLLAAAIPPSHATSLTSPILVSAHTSGDISCLSTIRVQFTDNIVEAAQLNQMLAASPFTFAPDIPGAAVWTERNTLEFVPSPRRLPGGQAYAATVNLASILPAGTAAPEPFSFKFLTRQQTLEVKPRGLEAVSENDASKLQLRGNVTLADVIADDDFPKILTAAQDGKNLAIEWTHYFGGEHLFLVTGIVRKEADSEVILTWNGAAINAKEIGTQAVPVPAAKTFDVLDARAVKGQEQYIEMRFSDQLMVGQSLSGLFELSNYDDYDLRYEINGSILRVYGRERWFETYTLTVRPGVKSALGIRLSAGKSFEVDFSELLPMARFVGSGVILPSSAGLTLPIETYNLKQVIVEAKQVFDKNMPQFLQVNTLNEKNELTRVGRVVWRKVVDLGYTPDKQNKWVRYGLDMTPLTQNFPGGLYVITLSFQRPHVAYQCPDAPETTEAALPELSDDWEASSSEESYWDYYDYDYYDYRNNRYNPCHRAYYVDFNGHDITASRNVLISDIGLIAKRDLHDVTVIATDLKTAQPLSGVEVALLDYQQQPQSMARTDANGMATLHFDRKPFVVTAHLGNQSGFLKLHDGAALSLSHFDVGGEEVKQGLKGLIYGERGVWRPGDTMYLTFLLWDQTRALPKAHPVIFELLNPSGQVVKVIKKTESVNGFYPFQVATAPDAPTGDWLARVRVGGVTFEQTLKIETVMPNRLKINISFGENVKMLSSGAISGELSSTWLHGGIAKNLNADVKVFFTERPTKFTTYTDYIFDDPSRKYEPEDTMIFDGALDENGKAVVESTIETASGSPGLLNANFRTRVFEDSGTFSSDRFTLPYSPYERYVGLRLPKGDAARGMLLTDTQHVAALALLDKDGNPVPQGQVEVTLYQLDWRWWWEDGANYIEKLSNEPIAKGVAEIQNGVGAWPFEVKFPSWGRYFVHACATAGGHCAGKIVYIDWPGWAGRAQKDAPGGSASILTFSAEKPKYVVGEKVALTIPTGKEGRGLVSIESGNKVLQAAWIEGGVEPTRYEFFATRDMTPNVYAHVTFLQPHKQKENDLPMRLYGVIPILVEDPATKLQPVIETPETLTPEQTAQIAISEAQGKPMTYTVAVVDEGLLGLTRFATPDPWKHFYQRIALNVKTWDLYDLVADAASGVLEKLLAIGGDGSLRGGEKKANRFPPMARFYGPFELQAGAKNTLDLDIPQYIGQVRVMVTAAQLDAFGSADKSLFVRKPLMVLGTLPRVLGPDEETDMPVSVFAMDDTVKEATVTVKTDGGLTLVGAAEQKVTFAAPGDEMVNFQIKAGSKTGVGVVTIEAVSGEQKAAQRIEIGVRMPGGEVTDAVSAYLPQGERWEQELAFSGMDGTNAALVELSRIPPLNLGKRLRFLVQYPHGCIEQTTSSVFPQVYLKTLLALAPAQQDEIQRNISAGIGRLQSFQTANGGFAYWPGVGKSDEWGSTYAGHFLIEAQNAGFQLPPNMLDRWKTYQMERASSWEAGGERGELMQAYRLYTLALAQVPDLGAMNRLREAEALPTTARWMLAAAYTLAGQPEAAAQLTENAELTVPKYNELSNTYGSELRDKAMILETLSLMKRMTDALPLVKELSDALSSDEWLSTQTTAYTLIALARHAGIGGDGLKTGKIECRVTWNGGEAQTVSSEAFIMQMPLTATGASGKLLVENTGQTALYPRLIVSGIPAPGTEKAASNGLELRVNYSNRQNEAIAPDAVEQGQDFFVTVTVKNTSPSAKYEEVALTQIFPSGWEIRNARFDAGETNAANYDYQDIRDDRIYTYFDISAGETKTFKAEVHAAYLGKFYLPMTTVETMYDAAINARVVGKWAQVVAPGTDIPAAPPVESETAEPTPTPAPSGSASQDNEERDAFNVWRQLNNLGNALANAISASGGGDKTFAALGFTNLSGNFTTLGASLSIRIADEIDDNGGLSEIKFNEEALTQIALSGDTLRDSETLAQLGKLSGADLIVTGMYLPVGARVHVTASAWNAADGEFIAAASASMSQADMQSYFYNPTFTAKPFDDVVKTAWQNMDLAADHGAEDMWEYPMNGARDVFHSLETFADYSDIVKAFGGAAFVSGPHTRTALNLGAQDDFGHYNPDFVIWLGKTLIPGATDMAFRDATQSAYDEYFREPARIAYLTYRETLKETAALEAQKADYLKKLEAGNTRFFCAGDVPAIDFAAVGEFEDEVEAKDNARKFRCFIIRRSIDGTADEFYEALLKLLSAYDRDFLSKNQ